MGLLSVLAVATGGEGQCVLKGHCGPGSPRRKSVATTGSSGPGSFPVTLPCFRQETWGSCRTITTIGSFRTDHISLPGPLDDSKLKSPGCELGKGTRRSERQMTVHLCPCVFMVYAYLMKLFRKCVWERGENSF